MKLKKFKEKDRKRIGIVIFMITCILLVSGVILYRTFAIFDVRTNQNVIKGTVQDPGNIYFAFYVDNEIQKDMPSIGEGYVLDEEASYCGVIGSNDNDITVSLTENYTILVHGVTTSRTKCNLYFVKGKFIQGKGVPIVEEGDGLYEVNHTDVSGIDEGFKETEYRFAGSNPNNYITFNGELWRIIGLVNVKARDTIEQRVKIIKDAPLEEKKAWDDNNSNDWTKSSLMIYLNSEYYEELKDNAKSMIDENIIWNIGGKIGNEDDSSNNLVTDWYEYERGDNVYNNAPTTWSKEENKIVKIGLMYPSDYGYSTNGKNMKREECLKIGICNWNEELECSQNAWLKPDSWFTWTITPNAATANLVFHISYKGFIHLKGGMVSDQNMVYPTLYLKQNVKILNDSQDGSESKPYHLQQIL